MPIEDFIGQRLVEITRPDGFDVPNCECVLQFENGTITITAEDNDGLRGDTYMAMFIQR